MTINNPMEFQEEIQKTAETNQVLDKQKNEKILAVKNNFKKINEYINIQMTWATTDVTRWLEWNINKLKLENRFLWKEINQIIKEWRSNKNIL